MLIKLILMEERPFILLLLEDRFGEVEKEKGEDLVAMTILTNNKTIGKNCNNSFGQWGLCEP